jgi:hypothetical protein
MRIGSWCVVSALGLASIGLAKEVVLTASADAEVRESNAMQRRGNPQSGEKWHTELSVRSNENKLIYLDFDLKPFKGKTITSADLRVRVRDDGWPTRPGGLRVYAFVEAPAWNEATIYYRDISHHDGAAPKRNLISPDNAPGLQADHAKNASPPPAYLPVNQLDTFDILPDVTRLLGYLNYGPVPAGATTQPAEVKLKAGEVLSFTGDDGKNREALVTHLNAAIAKNADRVTFLITSKYDGDPAPVNRSNMVLASKEFDPDNDGPMPVGAWAPQLTVTVKE